MLTSITTQLLLELVHYCDYPKATCHSFQFVTLDVLSELAYSTFTILIEFNGRSSCYIDLLVPLKFLCRCLTTYFRAKSKILLCRKSTLPFLSSRGKNNRASQGTSALRHKSCPKTYSYVDSQGTSGKFCRPFPTKTWKLVRRRALSQ